MNIYIWSEFVPPTESIVYKMNADSSGNLYVPVSGLDSGLSYASYSWKISVDFGKETTYSGTGSNGGQITLSGYTSGTNHTIMIKPVSEGYQWARAFAFRESGMSGAPLLTEIIYDGSYMGYGVSATSTGNYFRQQQYYGCTNLTYAPEEVLPSGVTSIGTYFRGGQYQSCSKLTVPAEEVLPNTITSIGENFRRMQYNGTKITYAPEEALPNSVTSIGSYFRAYQYYGVSYITEIKGWKDLDIGGGYYRQGQFGYASGNKTVKVLGNVGKSSYDTSTTLDNSYVTTVYVPSDYLSNFINSSSYPRSAITDSKFVGY